MNYIHQIQADLAGHIACVETLRQQMRQFTAFLHGPKFTGEENGEPKNWINTADVLNWLREVDTAALMAGEHAKANWRPAPKYEPCVKCGCTEPLNDDKLCSSCS